MTPAATECVPSPVPIGVGTWAWGNQFVWGYEPSQDADLEQCFRGAVDAGLCFFDTADSYGTGRFHGRSESLLGRFCAAVPAAVRDRLTVATKLAPFPWRLGRKGFAAAFRSSLGRLQGKLDRVQLHWSTARYAPWQETPLLDGLADLVQGGEVRSLGVSNMGPRRLRQMHAHLADRGVPLVSLQVQLSLLSPRALEPEGVGDVCRELGIDLIAYSPLALGLLARNAGDDISALSRPRQALFRRLGPRIQPLLGCLDAIAEAHDSTRSAAALNWCRSHGAMPIPGLRNVRQVAEAVGALDWAMDASEREELDRYAVANAARTLGNPFQSD